MRTLERLGFVDDDGRLLLPLEYGKSGFANFEGLKRLLPAVEALSQLGHEQIKLWIANPKDAAVITGANTSRADLSKRDAPLALVMPLWAGDTKAEVRERAKLGSVFLDLDTMGLSFKGNQAKPAILEGLKDLGKAAKVNDKTNNTDKKQRLAKAQAAAQMQRIRILELEAAA